jgi:fermentation-respiration switch protein FrsA (DUF1100 family)
MPSLTISIATFAGLYMLIAGAMFVFQRSFLYFPTTLAPDLAAASVEGLVAVRSQSEPGLELVHWYRPPALPGGPVVVVFHGNAGHIGDRVPKYRGLLEAGFGLFLAEYRGYGGNPGRPSEEGMTADARSVMAVLADLEVAPDRIVLYGESLGTASAVKMASEQHVAGLVLEAPFTSIADVAQRHYWYLPARWLLLDKWDVAGHVREVAAPILVVHGERDRVVPTVFGRRLFEQAAEPKEALFHPKAGHNDLWEYPEVRRQIMEFVRAQVPAATQAQETVN